jgi:hypothetical protein
MRTGGIVGSWEFGRDEDVDFDGWPEKWRRHQDRDHPAYLPIRIVAHDEGLLRLAQAADLKLLQSWPSIQSMIPGLPQLPPSVADAIADRYFRIELDGGWAMVQSPPVTVDPLYRYRLELSIKTESLVFDHAYAELVFLNAKNEVIGQFPTKPFTGSTEWTSIRSDLVPVPIGAVSVGARLIVRPMKIASESDIKGAAGFDQIVIRKLPQMRVTTDQRLAVYDVGDRPQIDVRVLGLDDGLAHVQFSVRDVDGNEVATHRMQFENIVSNSEAAIEGVAQWELPELPPGYYVIHSLLGSIERPSLSSETTIAILASLPSATRSGPYGWTLPRLTNTDVDIKRIPDWLERLGVSVVKYPCWVAPDDRTELDNVAWFVGRLEEKEIRPVGMLDFPPESVLAKIDERERREPYAANFFRDAAVWQPLLEPVMTRLSLKVRTWQLGADNDTSFLGRPQLKQTIKSIGRELQGFGQPIGVSFSWPWVEPLPPSSERSWAAINLSTSIPLAADELDAYLQNQNVAEGATRDKVETWVTLDPLDASAYSRDTRITDLVLRMTTVRGYAVPATFVTNPLDPKRGLLRSDWRPNELLLPWRTTATLLADLSRVGNLQMRNGSSTIVLADEDRTSIVVWNPKKTTEQIYLGDSIRQVDVWGNTKVPKKQVVDRKPIHLIDVGPVPTFLIDVDPVLVAFRMSTRLVEKTLDSLLGRPQTVSLEFNNPTREAMSGEVRLKPRDDWQVDSRPQSFDLSAGRVTTHTFDVSLRNSAKIGDAPLEFEFILRTQPLRRFAVTRSLHVGPEGLDIEVTTRMAGEELLVSLTMTNHTDKDQLYDCMIFPPGGRQYQRRQVTIPAGETIKRLFPWADGQSLLGQRMLLRAVELNGDRVLNQLVDIVP